MIKETFLAFRFYLEFTFEFLRQPFMHAFLNSYWRVVYACFISQREFTSFILAPSSLIPKIWALIIHTKDSYQLTSNFEQGAAISLFTLILSPFTILTTFLTVFGFITFIFTLFLPLIINNLLTLTAVFLALFTSASAASSLFLLYLTKAFEFSHQKTCFSD